jgi:microsomal epoxide hydrolase
MAVVEPARIEVDQAILDRIARRVADADIGYAPDDDAHWKYGVDVAWLRDLREHWRDRYDWRRAEAAFNAHAQFRCEIDGVPIHFFKFPAKGGKGYPLMLTHGWPGSPLEFMACAPALAEQGYGFSGRPPRPIGPSKVASMWRRLMVDALGHARFAAQGGDWGSAVTAALGHAHGDVVSAIHLNMLHLGPTADPTPDVAEWQGTVMGLLMREGAYAMIHGTKPQTIGNALTDSPIGFAGWVIEKCRTWSDCGGNVESVFSKDALITNVMTYLATGNVQSGIWMYNGLAADSFFPGPIKVPTGFAAFPAEFIPPPPRAAVEKLINIVRWTVMPKGGHFAAWEQPEAFALEVGDFFRAQH